MRENRRVRGLRRVADRIERSRIEDAGLPIESLDEGPLIIPAQSQVDRQAFGRAPVILEE